MYQYFAKMLHIALKKYVKIILKRSEMFDRKMTELSIDFVNAILRKNALNILVTLHQTVASSTTIVPKLPFLFDIDS